MMAEQASTAESTASASGESELARTIRDIEHQIEHLVRSNRELEDFLQSNGAPSNISVCHLRHVISPAHPRPGFTRPGEDKSLRMAIGENIVSIARRRAIVDDLQRRQAGASATQTSEVQPMDINGSGVYL